MSTDLAVRSRLRVMEHEAFLARRHWPSVLILGVLLPLAFVLAMGVGLGTVVDAHGNRLGVSYLQFVAPGVLTATALQLATSEMAWPLHAGLHFTRQLHAMAASPISPVQICDGLLLWLAVRLTVNLGVFLGILAAVGGVYRGWIVLAIPVAVLTAVAFGSNIAALTASVADEGNTFNIIFRFVVTPMFLFSGTFYPIGELPAWCRWLAYVSPLWHGTEVARGAAIGGIGGWAVVGHLTFLVVLLVVGVSLARWRLRVRLHS